MKADMVPYDLRRKVEEHVEALFVVAEKRYNRTIARPTVVWKNRSAVAGTARYGKWELSLNPELFLKNIDLFFKSTIPHEVAHFVAKVVYAAKGHGAQWMDACLSLGMSNVKRCHNYDIKDVVVKQKRWEYVCPCGVKRSYTTTRHNRIQAGKQSWTCTRCGGKITKI